MPPKKDFLQGEGDKLLSSKYIPLKEKNFQ
jgi:hypothetical protein